MKNNQLEKILNPITFIFINGAIILAAELTGTLFLRTGIIHIIAILFILLAVIRIFVRHYTYDPILEKFFRASLIALFVFAVSHIVEYFSMHMDAGMPYYSDAIFADTVNFYLISLMLIIIGAETFLKIHDNHSTPTTKILAPLIGGLVILTGFFVTGNGAVSLELNTPFPYLYILSVIFFGLLALRKIRKIGRYVKLASGFVKYLSASIILIVLATIPYIFYEFIEYNLRLPLHQIMYSSHFLFYAALSLMFLAFSRVEVSGGLYDDLKEESAIMKN